jgi:hypothetical protein
MQCNAMQCNGNEPQQSLNGWWEGCGLISYMSDGHISDFNIRTKIFWFGPFASLKSKPKNGMILEYRLSCLVYSQILAKHTFHEWFPLLLLRRGEGLYRSLTIYLSLKQCSFVALRSPKPCRFMSHSWYLQKALMSKGALTWFETIWSLVWNHFLNEN